MAWAAREGWRVVSYQHDGVVLRPPVTCGTGSEAARRACAALSRACSDALQAGFAMSSLHVRARCSLPFISFRHGPGSSRVEQQQGSFSVMDLTFI